MKFAFNLIITTIILGVAVLIIYYIFKDDLENTEVEKDEFDIETLAQKLKDTLNSITNMNIAELALNEEETKKREEQKTKLSKALRNCGFGDQGEKAYVKDFMKDLLQRYYKINEYTIDNVIHFSEDDKLNIQDKFDILFFYYKAKHEGFAFEKLCEENQIQIEKQYEDGIYYEIDKKDIERVYESIHPKLSYVDKLEIITQRIYQISRGLGVVDELRDQSCLDGISGGVSGITDSDYNYMEEVIFDDNNEKTMFRHDSVWVFWRGRSVHLSFLSFGSKRELQRICKNIYRYDAPYYLSGIKGKIVADDKKGNRITVARPPFADSWKFFVRKFESVRFMNIEELIKGEGSKIVIETVKYIMKDSAVVISGNMGTGKTTFLKAMIRELDPTLSIRVEEDVFETNLNRIYPKRNICSFRKTDHISLVDGMVFIKKTDGDVLILGEVAEQASAALLIQQTEISPQALCTTHQATTDKVIEAFSNAGLAMRFYNSEKVAERQVANAIQWDIHMKKTRGGVRFIERITEIIPKEEIDIPDNLPIKETFRQFCMKMTRTKTYETRDIIVFENNQYVVKNPFSERSLIKLRELLYQKSDEDLHTFEEFYKNNYEALETKGA